MRTDGGFEIPVAHPKSESAGGRGLKILGCAHLRRTHARADARFTAVTICSQWLPKTSQR